MFGYLSDVNFVDGKALTPSHFAEENAGFWDPKPFSGGYGYNGFHLEFAPGNSKTYSQQWSGNIVNGSRSFDGNFSTQPSKSDAQDGTLTFTPPLENVTSIRLYLDEDQDQFGSRYATINGAFNKTGRATGWKDYTAQLGGTTLTTIGWVTSGNSITSLSIFAIEVNGEVLLEYSSAGYDTSGNGNHFFASNIDAPIGLEGSGGFGAVLYTGNGSGISIDSLKFSPDLVWIKNVSNSTSHNIFDTVRGPNKPLFSDLTSDELSDGRLTSFDSNGFTLDDDNAVNAASTNHIAWCWKAGDSTVTNNDGSVETQVSVSQDYGFSVVTYTAGGAGSTHGHGLDSAPGFIMMRSRTVNGGWQVGHKDIGWSSRLVLNTTAPTESAPAAWNSTAPNDSVFTLGSTSLNQGNMVAYCWTEVPGYSHFGSFYHTAGVAGKAVTGFRPGFVMVKRVSEVDSWVIFDESRSQNDALFANTNAGQNPGWAFSFDSDGFSWQGGSLNAGDHIYIAFAGAFGDSDIVTDSPLKNYCTLSPYQPTSATLSRGNLSYAAAGSNKNAIGTMGVSKGKWYWEVTNPDGYWAIGVAKDGGIAVRENSQYNDFWGIGWNDVAVSPPNVDTFYPLSGSVIGVAFDRDAGTLEFFADGVSGGIAHTGLTDGIYLPSVTTYNGTDDINFGQFPFKYTPPAGFRGLYV